MKFPFSMLLDFVRTSMSAEEIGDLLTMVGFELEGIEEIEEEKVLDVNVCSNRGDGLSVMGLAREVLAKSSDASPTDLFERAAAKFPTEDEHQPSELEVPVVIETDQCSRFAYRGFRGIPNRQAPELIRKRLRQAGHRSISLFVDLTNYVMLEIGQPLHAYDLGKLKGPEIIVREAKVGEKLTTLNDMTFDLRPDQMMICDSSGPIGVAGVMGGAATEVDENTIEVLLEAAHFSNTSVRRTRKQLALNTEASYRFERSVDPDNVVAALNRCRELLADLGYEANCVKGVTDVFPLPKKHRSVRLRLSRAEMLLGVAISPDEAELYLKKLGFAYQGSGGEYRVTPPSWRYDIEREEDLIEDLGRIHGYERIPERLPEGSTPLGGLQGQFLLEDRLIEMALRLGYEQVMTHTIVGESKLDATQDKIQLPNPGSWETSSIRDSLLPGLAAVVRRSGGFGQRVVELGPIFRNTPQPNSTLKCLALLGSGHLIQPDKKSQEGTGTDDQSRLPQTDFYSLKADLLVLAGIAGEKLEFEPSSQDKRFHPTRQAAIVGKTWRGVIGQMRPGLPEKGALGPATFAAEILLGDAAPSVETHVAGVSRFPSIRRDIAFLTDKAAPFAQFEQAIRDSLSDTLEDLWLFDIYEGENLPEGKVSYAVALTLRNWDHTFTDEEANQEREKAVVALERLGAIRR